MLQSYRSNQSGEPELDGRPQDSPSAANRTALRRTAPHDGAGDGARELFKRRDDDRRLRAF